MAARVRIDRGMVRAIVERGALSGADAAAEFMASQQRRATRSRRLRNGIETEAGRDAQGVYARAGVGKGKALFFWRFEEFGVVHDPAGGPFIRQALWSNTGVVGRMMLKGR